MPNIKSKLFIRFGILICLSFVVFIWGLFPNYVLQSYSKGIYPITSTCLRWISSLFPFALGDILYAIIIICTLKLIIGFFKRVKNKGWQKSDNLKVPIYIINAFLIFYISFNLLWGLNYSRPSISKQLKISDQKYTVKELVMLGDFFIDKVNKIQPQIPSNLTYNITDLRQTSIVAYQKATKENPFFSYSVPSLKPVLNSFIISKIGIEGYYNPLSSEANVNMKLPAWVLPFVACHEIAHQLGVAKEDEANLTAYLVGRNSNNMNLQYSVNYNMLRYILFEIRYKSPEDYNLMLDKISAQVLANFKTENDFWAKYNGEMSNYMTLAFDKFLKFNNQKSGIDSYQNIVVWLWNIHKSELKKSESQVSENLKD